MDFVFVLLQSIDLLVTLGENQCFWRVRRMESIVFLI